MLKDEIRYIIFLTEKIWFFLGLITGNEETDLLYDDEAVRKIMECHYWLMQEFRESEYTRKNVKNRGFA